MKGRAAALAVLGFLAGLASPARSRTWAEPTPAPHPWKESTRASDQDVAALGFDPAVVELLDEKTAAKADLLYGPKGSRWPAMGLAWPVESTRSDGLMRSERAGLAARGYVLFLAERNYGTDPDRIAIVKATDPLAPVALRETAGPDGKTTNRRLLERLRRWGAETPFDLLGAGPDWVEIELRQVPGELEAFVRSVGEIAPDAVGGEAGSAARLEEEIRRTRRLLLWWE